MDTKQFEGFTPGPWRVGTKYDDEVCAAVTVHGVAQNQMIGRTLGNAPNARLIAAAPALLAEITRLQAVNKALVTALERLHDDWVTISGIDGAAGDEYEDIVSIDDQVRAALAAAAKAAV